MAIRVPWTTLAILSGPVLALAATTVGCAEPGPIDAICGHNAYNAVALIAVATWLLNLFIYGLVVAWRMLR